MELKKTTKEVAYSLELLESLTEKLNQKTTNEEGLVEERDSLQSIRILSQRIRVTEQLHNEMKDWYKKTKDKDEQDRIDNELAFRNIKRVMMIVSDTLNVSEMLGLQFVNCCEDSMNRVSKVSCEINFVKDWVKRKNSAMVEVKEYVETLTIQF
ncbi:hypothetical protein L6452_22421 [Arctium lappa]|uniref:Uncharacterized protein n=1 Tax=Arctium lappa TaxID=4217 RepID=A0ACB9AYX5_ARCLA|nr:hypothetical protein L6452_22421 [Arctium lappa]